MPEEQCNGFDPVIVGKLRLEIAMTKRTALLSIAMSSAVIFLGGCASSPDAEERRMHMEADIDEIVAYPLDESEVGTPKRCLTNSDYRRYRALGDRHVLFEGRGEKMWVNVLRGRCIEMRRAEVFVIEPTSDGRICDMDRFGVMRRDLMHVNEAALSSTRGCTFGEFKPILPVQVEEIEDRLDEG